MNPGMCPVRLSFAKINPSDESCRKKCDEDRQCGTAMKCCFTGCTMQCTHPVHSGMLLQSEFFFVFTVLGLF